MTQENVTEPDAEIMANTRHLIQRGRRWHYNRAFPLDVQPALGPAPFRVSLRTESLSEAQRAKGEAERRYWAKVDQARASGARRGAALDSAAAESLAVQWFRETLAGDASALKAVASPDALEEALSSLPGEMIELRREMVEGDADGWRMAKAAAARAGFAAATPELVRLIMRARIARAELFGARAVGNYGKRPSDLLFAAALEEPQGLPSTVAPAAPQRTIADLVEAYQADRSDHVSESTRSAWRSVFRVLRETLGDATPVATLTRDDGRRLFDTVRSLPAGLGKSAALRGLTAPEAAAKAKREGLPTISAKTINGSYMGFTSSLFHWAVLEGWIAANPVSGLTVRDPVPARAKRDPFNAEQLQAIFGSDPWTPPGETRGPNAIRYWGPLIGLYQGLRRGEVAQLRVATFKQVDGVPMFAVTGDRLKTVNAYRSLPIHPELVRLGLPAFAVERARGGAEFLFGAQGADANGKWGDALGDWFSRKVAALGLQGTRLGFHSFRHCFEDALREAGLHGTAIGAALAGRASGDKVAAAYGGGFSAAALADAIGRISYPFLRLTSSH